MLIRFRFPEVFFGMLLAVAILAMGALFSSSSNHQISREPSEKPAKTEQTQSTQDKNWWAWTTHDPAGFYTALLVIVGGAQAVLFLWQLRLIRDGLADTKDAAKAAKDSAQAALDASRPWLDIDIATTGSFEDHGREITRLFCKVTITNIGKSPAPWTNISLLIEHRIHRSEHTILGLRGPSIFPGVPITLHRHAFAHDTATTNEWGGANLRLKAVLKYGTNTKSDGVTERAWNINSESVSGIFLRDFASHQGFALDHIPEEDRTT